MLHCKQNLRIWSLLLHESMKPDQAVVEHPEVQPPPFQEARDNTAFLQPQPAVRGAKE